MIGFSKYHGCGNSFVITKEEDVKDYDFSDLALNICKEETGIGADGFIIVRTKPALEMIFYNRDGSRAPMCGNGIRCFAKYCSDSGITSEKHFPVKTLAGDMIISITAEDPFMVEINMGKPLFDPRECAIENEQEPFLRRKIDNGKGGEITVSTIFMGTIHTVTMTDDLGSFDCEGIGSYICSHPVFTEKTNVNMVELIDENTLKMRTYERGVGMTLACGTGACASAVIAMNEGKCRNEVDVQLPLGTLHITKTENGDILMRGPAEKIAEGRLYLNI